MKTKNKIGPNIEPCGTPDVTDTWEDFVRLAPLNRFKPSSKKFY